MMKHLFNFFTVCIILTGLNTQIAAQSAFNPVTGCVEVDGECVPNTVVTAMPFLRIAPDARGGAMGDVGISMTPSAASIHYNASNLVFAEKDNGLALTYTPWLRDLNLDDVYLLYMSGFYQIDEFQTIAGSFRYFSLGEIEFTDGQGGPLGLGMPREAEAAISYARKLGDNFSAALTGKYIYSNLATGQSLGGVDIQTASAFAADISMTYKSDINLGDRKGNMTYGLAITNIGSKVSYRVDNEVEDFIPTNIGLGAGLFMEVDEYNSLEFSLEFNKLMIPSPVSELLLEDDTFIDNPEYDKDEDGTADYRQLSLFDGIFGSFSDAQGGLGEELKEITISAGVEYWYNKQFAARAGYFHEHSEKGGRKYFTIGLGLQYNIFGIDLSYLVPTSNQRTPLDNTLRFGLSFDLQGSNQQGVKVVN